MRINGNLKILLFLAASVFILFGPAESDDNDPALLHLKQLSMEELLTIEITSVSKKKEPLSDAPAAVFVITREDIRRTGVTHIADAPRMVPGMEVGNVDEYATLDARIGWFPREHIEVSLVGRNLLEDRHLEFQSRQFLHLSTQVERSVSLKLSWYF